MRSLLRWLIGAASEREFRTDLSIARAAIEGAEIRAQNERLMLRSRIEALQQFMAEIQRAILEERPLTEIRARLPPTAAGDPGTGSVTTPTCGSTGNIGNYDVKTGPKLAVKEVMPDGPKPNDKTVAPDHLRARER